VTIERVACGVDGFARGVSAAGLPDEYAPKLALAA
jgi:hypothetical protein